MLSFTNGAFFDLVSVDLAEYSTLYQEPLVVRFVGYRHDGTVVTNHITTDGIIDGTGPLADFQTFYFGPDFSGLSRVELPTWGWSLDNLVVAVPEPPVCQVLILGAALAALWSFKRKT
jgi:hypothetical protein